MADPTLTAVWCLECCGLVLATTAPMRPPTVACWVQAVWPDRTTVQVYRLADGAQRVREETWCQCGQPREDA